MPNAALSPIAGPDPDEVTRRIVLPLRRTPASSMSSLPAPAWLYGPIDGADHDSGDPVAAADETADAADSDDRGHPGGRLRWQTSTAGAIALILVGLLACAVTAYSVFRSDSSTDVPVQFPASAGPTTTAPGAGGSSSAVATGAATQPAASAGEIVVSVVGLVRTPGLVHVPDGSRVADALTRAGGAREGADLLGLNLAQSVHDGDQILVGYADTDGGTPIRSIVISDAPVDASSVQDSGQAGVAESGGAKVDLNSADVAALDALPGVGPVTAASILDWRERNGRFTSVDQLGEVDGIGPARLARLRDLVTV
ncbi:hypothetical protein GCM10027169_12420 [Gordonia jinhuaensis]|uniref:Helix-hairpin-helix DNA-binding motif class 1 domain-containing protein n=1 Tax=Gordonia jinhuaensis TaxID=1517702 RepID=A0A916SXR8_9ACTN|nr:ComEA family DNA-binding protein [Gordonia jinhuaensis]GGB22064.1 hypothetical protein GCM10011489_07750 [Gordonia jinhuaensis]